MGLRVFVASLYGLAASSPAVAQVGLEGPPDTWAEWAWWAGSVVGPALCLFAQRVGAAYLRARARGETHTEALDDVADVLDDDDPERGCSHDGGSVAAPSDRRRGE